MDRPLVSVITVATRDPALISALLDSIDATATPEVPVEVVVVLGAASAAVAAVVDARPGVRVVRSDVNTGTLAAQNIAFGLARAPFAFAVHEDTELRPGCIPQLLETAARHPRAGAIGPRVLNPNGTLQHLGGVLWGTGEMTPLHERTAPEFVRATEPFRVGVTAAAGTFLRRAAWEGTGGYDERYFPFTYGDVDLSVAMRAHGWDVLLDPAAVITHRRGASQAEGGGALSTLRFRDWVYARHRALLLAKWPEHVPALSRRPEGVDRGSVPPQLVAAALPAPARAPERPPARAARPLTGDLTPQEGPIPDVLRRRLLDAEHEVLEAFARDLVAETDARGAEIRELWSALQATRAAEARLLARIGELEGELGELRPRADAHDGARPGRWRRLRGALLRAARR